MLNIETARWRRECRTPTLRYAVGVAVFTMLVMATLIAMAWPFPSLRGV